MLLKIKALRKQAKMTQTELAELMGVTQGAVAQWEREQSLPNPRQLTALAKALGCSISELFEEGGVEACPQRETA